MCWMTRGKGTSQGRARKLIFSAGRLNIFIIGFLLISAVLLYWIIPNMLTFLARAGIETFEHYKYFFMAIIGRPVSFVCLVHVYEISAGPGKAWMPRRKFVNLNSSCNMKDT